MLDNKIEDHISKSQTINLIHVLIVVPLLGYIGYKSIKRELIPQPVGYVVALLALIVLGVHLYLFFKKGDTMKSLNFLNLKAQ